MLTPGLVGESHATVDGSMLASAVGSGALEVFSTPSMVGLMENAARRAVESLLPPGQITVGTRLDIRHVAATPVGVAVRAHDELVEVDGRKLIFSVAAYDAQEKIGEGTHERSVVDPARLLARANAKLDSRPG
jgi:predicted thioesterase